MGSRKWSSPKTYSAVPVTTNYVRVLISSHKMNGRMYVNVRCSAQGQSYYAVARIGRTSVSLEEDSQPISMTLHERAVLKETVDSSGWFAP